MRTFALLSLVAACQTLATPPVTVVKPVTDVVHGETIVDDYRWLEALEADSSEVQVWTSAQNLRTQSLLDGLPCHSTLEQQLAPLMSIGSIGLPKRDGGFAFWTERAGGQNQAVLYVGSDPALTPRGAGAPTGPLRDAKRELLNVNTLDAKGLTSLDWWEPSHDGRLLAFGTSKSGSEMSVLHVLDVATGSWLADEIVGKIDFAGWTPDASAFLYTRLANVADPYSREICWHVLARHPRHDSVLFRQSEPSRVPGAALSRDARWLLIQQSRGWQASDLFVGDLAGWIRMGMPEGGPVLTPIAVDLDANFQPAAIVGDTLFMQTSLDAPKGALYSVDLTAPARANWNLIIPTRESEVLDSVSYAGGVLVAIYARDVVTHIERFSPSGVSLGDIVLPGLGSANAATDEMRTDGFLSYTSFNEPRSIYTIDFRTGASALWARPEVPVDPQSVSVQQVFVASKDGTKIPMFIVHKKGLKPTGSLPTLLYGYGGFNVNLEPYFDPTLFPWLDAGGVYAVANLRGGGEYGERWHRDGMLSKKQNVFDDFYACAQWLTAQKYTDAAHLAIKGGSNGGLLTGVAITQRPELFCAAISAVPLLDMVRFQNFLMAKFWVPEYGSSESAEQFAWIRAYSPYHNVRVGTKYPAVLFTAGENDSRVHPLHARKMAARMQALASNDDAIDPILLWVDRDAGHGQGKPLANRIAEQADQWSFLMWQTGLCDQ
ncbi:MAG: S9 family peptidase [Phycisphaerales bacterium]|nr:S9 family peptidase [Phycisphaerales bacterium]